MAHITCNYSQIECDDETMTVVTTTSYRRGEWTYLFIGAPGFWLRRQAEIYGNATRPIFGLLWNVL